MRRTLSRCHLRCSREILVHTLHAALTSLREQLPVTQCIGHASDARPASSMSCLLLVLCFAQRTIESEVYFLQNFELWQKTWRFPGRGGDAFEKPVVYILFWDLSGIDVIICCLSIRHLLVGGYRPMCSAKAQASESYQAFNSR